MRRGKFELPTSAVMAGKTMTTEQLNIIIEELQEPRLFYAQEVYEEIDAPPKFYAFMQPYVDHP